MSAVLGFDFGTKKIGVATGQTVTKTATPLACLKTPYEEHEWQAFAKLFEQWQPRACVVGCALHDDQTQSKTGDLAMAFGESLSKRFGVELYYVNEHLTSFEARLLAKKLGKQSPALDSLAAMFILETWLQERR